VSSSKIPIRFWLLTLAALAGAAITAALGVWQLSRADQKLALQAAMDGQQKRAMLDSRALATAVVGSDALYRLTILRGSWIGKDTVFLDNRQMNGKQGFFVLTPLRIQNSASTVVVQRGWVQRSFTDRTQLPVVPTPQGTVQLTGRIAPPPSKLYDFQPSDGGLIRQNLDLAGFSQEIGVPLVPVSVLQLSPAADGLTRDWPAVNLGVEKNYGYAFQWFALCGLIVFLYGWFQIVRRFISPR
jgi:surfeit locus 1 family protein